MKAVGATLPVTRELSTTAELSDRGTGRVAPAALVGGTPCTVATVVGDPPPKTKVPSPSTAAEASCTGVVSAVACETAPELVRTVSVPESDEPAASRPPSTRRSLPFATTSSRERGEGRVQACTPASSEGGGCAGRCRPAAPPGWPGGVPPGSPK